MVEHADVVVIGAGLGGLAAAVTAAGRGRHVVVLEQADGPGGYATCFQRGPYRFDASLHALNGLAPGGGVERLYAELDISRRLHLERLDPLYLARFPEMDVTAHADRFRYESEVISHFPGQAPGIRALLDEQVAAHADTRRMAEDQAAGRRLSIEEMASRYPTMVGLSGETAEQTMVRHGLDPRARAVLGSLWVYLGLPPSRLSSLLYAVLVTSYHDYGGWYPQGGAAATSRALVDALHERGGEIVYGQRAVRLALSDRHVTAVETDGGLRITADQFISNASAPTTMLEMVGREHLPADYVHRLEDPAPSYTTVAVYLGLDRDLFAERGLPHEVFVAPAFDPDAIERAALAGDWEHAGVAITDYTRVDPGCAPAGHASIVVGAVAAWDHQDTWGTGGVLSGYHTNPRYLDMKERVADRLVAVAESHLPGLRAAIRQREVSTPLTNWSYTANPRGAIEGYENSPANTGLGFLPQETPLSNLFLAGAWTNSGGQNPAIQSGVSAAERALRTATLASP